MTDMEHKPYVPVDSTMREFTVRALVLGLAMCVILGAANELLGPYCERIQLHLTQTIDILPGQTAQILHRDRLAWGGHIPKPIEPQFNTIWALTGFTEENGATRVAPGSHELGGPNRQQDMSQDETVGAAMAAGSALIYTGKVVHGAGANLTDEWRYGMHVSFVVGWLRPEEASPLVVSRERAAELPERARQLLGWGSYHSDGGGRTWLVDFEDAERLFA